MSERAIIEQGARLRREIRQLEAQHEALSRNKYRDFERAYSLSLAPTGERHLESERVYGRAIRARYAMKATREHMGEKCAELAQVQRELAEWKEKVQPLNVA